jgi:hypothetical protein
MTPSQITKPHSQFYYICTGPQPPPISAPTQILLFKDPSFIHIIGPYPPSQTDSSNIAYAASISDLSISTDGSFYPTTGDADCMILCSCPGSPYGTTNTHARAELLGILSAIYISYHAEIIFPIQSGPYVFHCNNKEMLNI